MDKNSDISLPIPESDNATPLVSMSDSSATRNSDNSSSNISNDQSRIKIVDNDLIDKEWIDKLKKIIHETKGNPYQQSIEINRLKAQFLEQKFNKVIKAE